MGLDVHLLDDYCEYCGKGTDVFEANITHNLGKMASHAGIYEALWHPERIGAKIASDILPVVRHGFEELKRDPSYYKQFDSPNGWGVYDDFVPWLEKYIIALEMYPTSVLKVSC